jgi:hypothetical protein
MLLIILLILLFLVLLGGGFAVPLLWIAAFIVLIVCLGAFGRGRWY